MVQVMLPADVEQFFLQVQHAVEGHPILKHRFLVAAEQGKLTSDHYKLWAKQELFLSDAFPQIIAAVIARMSDIETRWHLVENLYEEYGEGQPGQVHALLIRRFIRALGGTDEEIAANTPLPETEYYILKLFELAEKRELPESLASLGPGNELLVLYEYGMLRKGLERLGIDHADVYLFLDANIEADVRHSKKVNATLVSFARSPEGQKLILKGTQEALDARTVVYDGLCRVLRL